MTLWRSNVERYWAYPSTFPETSCNAVLESLAAGLIVVTTDLGAQSETTLGFAELVPPLAGPADRPAFVQRYREALRRVLAERSRDPAAFASRRYRQVQGILAGQTWAALAREWEESIITWKPQQPRPQPATALRPSLHWVVSRGLADCLVRNRWSVAFTSPSLGRLLLLSPGAPGQIAVADRSFEGSSAVWSEGQSLWLAGLFQLWRFEKTPVSDGAVGGPDSAYVPRAGHVIGEHDVRDLTMGPGGDLLFVSGASDCVCRLHLRQGVQRVWQPDANLTARLGPLQLTGLAVAAGQPLLVTATAGTTGLLIDTELDRVIAEGPFQFVAPRYHQGRLWVLDGASNHLGTIDLESGHFERRAACPGMPRGLALEGNHALAALSPAAGEVKSRTGLAVIDLIQGTIVESLWVEGEGVDVRGVALLPGVLRPALCALEAEEVRRFLPVPGFKQDAPATSEQTGQDSSSAVPPEAATAAARGRDLLRRGLLDEAAAAFEEALGLHPGWAEVENLLGKVHHREGRLDAAAAAFDRAAQAQPRLAEAFANLGDVRKDQKRFADAERAYSQALALRPAYPEVAFLLGRVLHTQGRHAEAVEAFRKGLVHRPDYPEGLNWLGDALLALGRLDEALRTVLRAFALKPKFAEAEVTLGLIHQAKHNGKEALDAFDRALALRPVFTVAENNRALALKSLGRPAEAAVALRRILDREPRYAIAWSNLGSMLKLLGQHQEAHDAYRRALEIQPDFAVAHSNALYCEQYLPGVTAASLAESHREWDFRHAARFRSNWPRFSVKRQAPGEPIRLGFVSEDLARHPVGYFLIRVLENLDRRRFPIICYSGRFKEDEVTQRFKAIATLWRLTLGVSDQALAEQIQADQIDILFDLSGHTQGGRLLMFARKPAPIQITWMGYVGTTGLAAMDYLLADPFEVPPGAEKDYPEGVLRMPDDYICYEPPDRAPPVAPLPARQRGSVTFASFNNGSKLNGEVLAVWAEILRRVPGSRLVLQYAGLDDPDTQKRFRDHLAAADIDPSRLELHGWTSQKQILERYNEVDVALDPFPYSGGLTTCEALWIGVPVVTWPGQTFAGRHSLSHLTNVGLTETIARDRDHYVELAVGLANDLDRLSALRAGLRERVAASPLCDGPRFARNFMALMEKLEPRPAPPLAEARPSSPAPAPAPAPAPPPSPPVLANGEQAQWKTEALRGQELQQQGKSAEAAAAYQRSLELNPSQPNVANNLGVVLLALEKPDEAGRAFDRALELRPEFPDALFNRGSLHQTGGRLNEAIAAYRQALQFRPGFALAATYLGKALTQVGQLDEGVRWCRTALELSPDLVEGELNLGVALARRRQLGEAEECFRRILARNPAHAAAHKNLASVLGSQGRHDEAAEQYAHVLRLQPDSAETRSAAAALEQYRDGVTAAHLAAIHRDWARLHADPLRRDWKPFANSRDPNRPLRLGLVSGDFRRHPVAFLLLRTLANMDRAQWAIHCYHMRPGADEFTHRFQALAAGWRTADQLADAALTELIRSDAIDILIDLSGHTSGNRLLTFARKPAPVQATWLGYVGTTGLDAIDYLIADRHHVPPGEEAHYAEKVLRLPDDYVCYDPPADSPAVRPFASGASGPITFGCFNNPTKFTASAIETWAAILKRTPRSRLMLRYFTFKDPATRKRLEEQFAGHGISADRLDLGVADSPEVLGLYNEVDVALDTFPYSGGLTTCEALWMGVPIVTWPGQTFAGRHSLSHLSNAGLTETIARDRNHYVELAVGLANDLDRLAAFRAGLRPRMAASPLCDGPRHARHLSDALRNVWRNFCEQQGQGEAMI